MKLSSNDCYNLSYFCRSENTAVLLVECMYCPFSPFLSLTHTDPLSSISSSSLSSHLYSCVLQYPHSPSLTFYLSSLSLFSSFLQSFRALETESAREREKNKGLFLLREINSSQMLMSSLSSYSAAFQNNNNNNNNCNTFSTKQNSELKTYNSNNEYITETVKSRQTFTPKKSPSNKNKSVTNNLALTVVDNSTRLRGI